MEGTFAGWLLRILDEKREAGKDPDFLLSRDECARIRAECGMLEQVIKKYWLYQNVPVDCGDGVTFEDVVNHFEAYPRDRERGTAHGKDRVVPEDKI